MRGFRSIGALLALAAGLLTPQPGTGAPAAGENDTQKIVYLSDRGPILIALHLRIDGQSFRVKHRAFLNTLFDHLDRNRDGVLNRAEAMAAPTAAVLSSPLGLLGFARRGAVGPRLTPASDGKVTRDGLAAYYARTGLPAFQISDGAIQSVRVRLAFPGNETSGEQLTDRLFKLLDTNGDGKLSRQELETAPTVLGKLDLDEDEMLTAEEVMGESAAYALPFATPRRPVMPGAARVVHAVADGPDEILARVLLQRYGKGGELSLAVLPGPTRATLAFLDRDRDGKLSLAELAQFGSKSADVSLTVRLGNRGEAPPVTLHSEKPGGKKRGAQAGITVKTSREGAMLHLGTTRLEIGSKQTTLTGFEANVRNQLKSVFRQADMANKGYLEKTDLQRIAFLRDAFEAIDSDDDGKVTEKELMAYVDRMAALARQAERSCVSMTVSSEGKGLFDLLDTNGDGKLSVRELRNAPRLLALLDGDGDGKLARAEVPRHYRAGLVLGPSGGQDPFRPVAVPSGIRRTPDVRRPARGPMWFQKMDRNRDGDVSRKEFVGTDEQFREIDSDGDGLISIEEAERYDRRKRAAGE